MNTRASWVHENDCTGDGILFGGDPSLRLGPVKYNIRTYTDPDGVLRRQGTVDGEQKILEKASRTHKLLLAIKKDRRLPISLQLNAGGTSAEIEMLDE